NVYGDDLTITGHSLGGGLAAAAGTVVGVETTTFNAAGVHSNTLEPFGLTRDDADGLVESFSVDGEILNGAQDSLLPMPTAVGARFELPAVDEDAGGVELHLMPAVIEGLETKRP
ncbi:MAG: hypothetical protein AAF772_09890, partial [Acidobacteriota bacterium]